jgi:hypothetical protein
MRLCDLHAAALLAFFERVHCALCAAAMRALLERNLDFLLFGGKACERQSDLLTAQYSKQASALKSKIAST